MNGELAFSRAKMPGVQGIIENVKYNGWVTRMVHIPKSDGKTLW
jgi:hypothetical protein